MPPLPLSPPALLLIRRPPATGKATTAFKAAAGRLAGRGPYIHTHAHKRPRPPLPSPPPHASWLMGTQQPQWPQQAFLAAQRRLASSGTGQGGDGDAVAPPAAAPAAPAHEHEQEECKGEEGHGAHHHTPSKPRPGAADIPGVYYADRRLAIVYTCKVCNTRAVKAFSKQAYDHGVVIVRCPGCNNLHLIADRLGWFEDGSWDVERLLREQGENVVAVNDDGILSLTPKDILGSGPGEGEGEDEEMKS